MRRILQFIWHYGLVADLLFAGFFIYSAYASWTSPVRLPAGTAKTIADVQERTLGLSAISGAISSSMTAASIILGVVGAIVGLGAQGLPNESKHHFLIGAAFCGFSLVAGVFAMAALPQLAWKENVAFSAYVSVLLAIQVFPLVPAFVRLCAGIFRVVHPKSGTGRQR